MMMEKMVILCRARFNIDCVHGVPLYFFSALLLSPLRFHALLESLAA